MNDTSVTLCTNCCLWYDFKI